MKITRVWKRYVAAQVYYPQYKIMGSDIKKEQHGFYCFKGTSWMETKLYPINQIAKPLVQNTNFLAKIRMPKHILQMKCAYAY